MCTVPDLSVVNAALAQLHPGSAAPCGAHNRSMVGKMWLLNVAEVLMAIWLALEGTPSILVMLVLAMVLLWDPDLPSIVILVMLVLAFLLWAPDMSSILAMLVLVKVLLRGPDLPSFLVLVMPVLAELRLGAPDLPSILVMLVLAMVLLWDLVVYTRHHRLAMTLANISWTAVS